MKRSFLPLVIFVLLWAAAFSIPSLRTFITRQFYGTSIIGLAAWPIYDHYDMEREDTWADTARRFPGDAAVQSLCIDQQIYPSLKNPEDQHLYYFYGFGPDNRSRPPFSILTRYDALIKDFPSNAWLIARRLRLTMEYFRGSRLAGEYSEHDVDGNRKKGIPAPERDKKIKPNLSPREIEQTIALCKMGQKLEPNNAFFNWVEIHFLLTQWRDAEAWNALDAGAKKTSWDSHLGDDLLSVVAALEKIEQRHLLWEEKKWLSLVTQWERGTPVYDTAYIISWEGIKARRQGEHAQALRLWGGLAECMRKLRDGAPFHSESSLALNAEIIAFNNASHDRQKALENAGGVPMSRLLRLNLFSQYAQQHGRSDLARVASSENQAINSYRQNSFKYYTANPPGWWASIKNTLLWMVCVYLLIVVCAASPIWLFTCLFYHAVAAEHQPQMEVSTPAPPKREIIGGALSFAGLSLPLTLGLAGILLTFFVTPGIWIFNPIAEKLGWRLIAPENAWVGIKSASRLNLDTSFWQSWFSDGGPLFTRSFDSKGLSLLLITLLALHATRSALAWQSRENEEKSARFRDFFVAISGGNFQEFTWSFRKHLIRIVDAMCYVAFLISVLALNISPFDSSDLVEISVLFTTATLFLVRFWPWMKKPHKRQAAIYALLLSHRVCSVALIAATVLYLVLAVVSLTLRTSEDQKVDRLIRHGEVNLAQMK